MSLLRESASRLHRTALGEADEPWRPAFADPSTFSRPWQWTTVGLPRPVNCPPASSASKDFALAPSDFPETPRISPQRPRIALKRLGNFPLAPGASVQLTRIDYISGPGR
jgi:hypothetical protein